LYGGKGLFAFGKNRQIIFRRQDIIAQYKGEFLTADQLERRYPGDTLGEYVIQDGDIIIDARNTNSGVGRYANDCNGRIRRGQQCNAKFETRRNNIYLIAKKNIYAGEEILVSYGREYWMM
jgi:hypothetical protein